ncbi:MAG: Holliday junction branch migration DNA helicase RuvB [Firmicutes bacterium]|nr:Holliday junction branch migration DNA helicase RuvB [Bacillota bacterium]
MEEFSRLITPDQSLGDSEFENPLRPKRLSEYIGQAKVKENLEIFISASKIRNDTLDHVLLYGPPGLGKTTLAMIIANELNTTIKITSGPAIERPGDLASILTNMQSKSVLFIDEIHRTPRSAEEILYPAMEDFSVDIVAGKGAMSASYRLSIPEFTLIGATTRAGQLGAPLRDRFGVILKLEMYSPAELEEIISRSACILGIQIEKNGSLEIANRSRGTPRIANRLLKRTRDFAQVHNNGKITFDMAKYALSCLEVDELGLDSNDRKILSTIIKFYDGGPVGLETLSAAVGEESITIEDIYEPYLLQIGFLNRTPRGRVATLLAYDYLKIKPKSFEQTAFI